MSWPESRELTLPYITYSQSSAKVPSMPVLQPPSVADFSPSGSNDEASAKLSVEFGLMVMRSVLTCKKPSF